MSHERRSIRFSGREIQDLLIAWIALGVAFAFLLNRQLVSALFGATGIVAVDDAILSVGVSMATVGVGFLLHELAHKVVAIKFGRVAEFRADYSMLLLAVGAGIAGFLFAAPGAVYHAGREITARENGLIAIAGPVTNLLLAGLFFPLVVLAPSPIVYQAGQLGVTVNLVLAAFNMIPFGPLDGRTVISWSVIVFALVFGLSVVLTYLSWTRIGLGF